MLLSKFFFALLVSDCALASLILTKKALPFVYNSGARIVKSFSFSSKKQIEQTPNFIQSKVEITDSNTNFINQKTFLDNTNLFNLESFIFRFIVFSFLYYYYQYFNINKKIDNKDYKIGLITWDYLIGLIETDGTFKISYFLSSTADL